MYNVRTLIWESTEVTCLSWTAKNNNKILLSNVYIVDTYLKTLHISLVLYLPLCEKPPVEEEIKWVMVSH